MACSAPIGPNFLKCISNTFASFSPHLAPIFSPHSAPIFSPHLAGQYLSHVSNMFWSPLPSHTPQERRLAFTFRIKDWLFGSFQTSFPMATMEQMQIIREAISEKKSQNCGLFPYRGGGSTPFFSFWGCFP